MGCYKVTFLTVAMNTISDNQLYEGCLEAAKNSAYLDTLTPYEKQALEHYAKGLQNTVTDAERAYWRAIKNNNIYDAADKVLALLTPSTEAPSRSTEREVFLNGFDFKQLDRLLSDLCLLDSKTHTLTPDARGAIVGIAEGLRKRGRLTVVKSRFAKACYAYYGKAIGSESNMSHGILNETAEYWSARVEALIPALKR
jgi:hypothetical protein